MEEDEVLLFFREKKKESWFRKGKMKAVIVIFIVTQGQYSNFQPIKKLIKKIMGSRWLPLATPWLRH
jgi:hypothetical protein